MKLQKLLIAISLLAGMSAIADPLKGQIELGLAIADGNTETQNLHAEFNLLKKTELWKHEANAAAFSSKGENQDTGITSTTAEKYTVDIKSDRNLDERSFLYGLGTYVSERFSGFDYQATIGVGYGYKVIANDTQTLAFEIGPGYRFSSVEVGKNQEEVTARVGETFDWKFSETAEFKQYINAEGGDDNTITKAGVEVQSKLTGSLALKVGVDAKYTDKVPVDQKASLREGKQVRRERLDSVTYVGITYSF